MYAGEQWDGDLGLYYNRARYLNTNTGRFFTQDSFEGNSEDPLSLHKYLYANNNPVNNLDPSGNTTLGEQVTILGIRSLAFINSVSLTASATLIANFDKILYWADWVDIGFDTALVISDILPDEGKIEINLPNSILTGKTGERDEQLWIEELRNKWFTDIVQIQNNNGHGIDAVARDPRGTLHFFEVKTTTGTTPPALSKDQAGNPQQFVISRLRQAASGKGYWANTDPHIINTAGNLINELQRGATVQLSKIEMFLPPSSTKPPVSVRALLSRWVPRTRRR